MKQIKRCQNRLCHSTKDLHINSKRTLKDGTVKIQYICNKCNSARCLKWYHASEINKQKRKEANRNNPNQYLYYARYWAKKTGHRLVKIKK